MALVVAACGGSDGAEDQVAAPTVAETDDGTAAVGADAVDPSAGAEEGDPAVGDPAAGGQDASTGDVGEPELSAGGSGIDCAEDCNIAMEGDSLTEGLGERLCLTVATGNCINSGRSGARVDEMVLSAPADIDDQVGADGNDVLILWGGTNDLWQDFHSTDPVANAAAIYDQITLYLDERRAAGWDYTFVVTIPPMDDATIQGRTELNDLIRANAAGADAVIDLAAEDRLADPFDIELRQSDGVHFTALGNNLVAVDHLVPAIQTLDGS
ncbi:MAG: SGNH/GDSL hydrolase family protein [Actinomycetota bacterium]